MESAIPSLLSCANGRLHASGVRLPPWLGSCAPRCEGLNSPVSTLNGGLGGHGFGHSSILILGGEWPIPCPGVRLCRGWNQRPLMSR